MLKDRPISFYYDDCLPAPVETLCTPVICYVCYLHDMLAILYTIIRVFMA